MNQGRPEAGALSLAAGTGGEIGEALKGFEVVGAAVGVARVIDRIHPQHQPLGAAGLRQAEADGDEHRVAPRHVGAGDRACRQASAGQRHGGVGEGGAAPGGEVHGHGVVLFEPQGLGH